MNGHDSAFAYHQNTAIGASPVGQVVALYDAILRDLRRASAAIEASQIEKRCNAINHALTVIGELQGVLDFERGGEVARHLNSFYNVTRAKVTHAGVTSALDELKELIGMFTRMRAAWSKVERTVGTSEPPPEFRIASKPQASVAQNVPVQNEEAPGPSGRWSA
jgi:flagellar protein FliS